MDLTPSISTGHDANTFLTGIDSYTQKLPTEVRDQVRANHLSDIAAHLPEGIAPGHVTRTIIDHPGEDAFPGSCLTFTYDPALWSPEAAATAAHDVIEGNGVSIDDAYDRAVTAYNRTAAPRGLEPLAESA